MKQLRVSNTGLHPQGATIPKELENKHLSASLVSALADSNSCHARWLFDQFTPERIKELQPVDNPINRGNWFHKLMEEFFKLPAEERTQDAFKNMAVKVSKESKIFTQLSRIPQAKKWLTDCMRGYYHLGGKPEQIKIARLESNQWGKKKMKDGLEFFVKGQIGKAKRETLGLVDQISIRDKGLQVLDWKTGGSAFEYKIGQKGDKGWKEARQQILYTQILRQEGHKVAAAGLIYPIASKQIKVPINDEELNARAVEDVERADGILDTLLQTNEFAFSPSYLCSWCPLVNICPQAMRGKSEKMVDARSKQPSEELLSEELDF